MGCGNGKGGCKSLMGYDLCIIVPKRNTCDIHWVSIHRAVTTNTRRDLHDTVLETTYIRSTWIHTGKYPGHATFPKPLRRDTSGYAAFMVDKRGCIFSMKAAIYALAKQAVLHSASHCQNTLALLSRYKSFIYIFGVGMNQVLALFTPA